LDSTVQKDYEIAVYKNPFTLTRDVYSSCIGMTLSEMLELVDIKQCRDVDICIAVNADIITTDKWSTYIIQKNDLIIVNIIPGFFWIAAIISAVLAASTTAYTSYKQTGNFNWIATAVAGVVGFAAGGYGGLLGAKGVNAAWGAGVIGTLLGMSAGGLTQAIMYTPPPAPNLSLGRIALGSTSGLQSKSRSSVLASPSLSGGNNVLDPYGPIPRPMGYHKIIPPYGAKPYTEIIGDDQYLRVVFVLGFGPLEITNPKIGDTDLDDFTDVEYESREGIAGDAPLTLYTDTIDEQSLEIKLTTDWTTRTSGEDADELSVDITFPGGLIYFNTTTGEEESVSVDVEWQYSITRMDAWSATQTISSSAARGGTIRKGARVTVAQDQYDIRMRRTTIDSIESSVIDDVYWTSMRAITNVHPINKSGLALFAMRIKATDALSGTVDTFSCIVRSKALDWGGVTWAEDTTNNPASLFRLVLQDAANKRAIADDRIDLVKLQEWHDFCVTNGFTYNSPGDFGSNVEDMLDEVAAAGRASKTYYDGQHSVIFDELQLTPRQHFSPRNTVEFSAQKIFHQQPHAFRVLFSNADKDWQQDERIVYDDGYNEENATLFEQLVLPGITSSDLAWKHGRYHIATTRLRPEIYSWTTDFEHLTCTRGDLVRVSHDATLWGVSWGRVTALQTDNGNTTGISFDQEMPMELGHEYAIRFRKVTGVSVLANVILDVGNPTTVVFQTSIVTVEGPAIGDLGHFGVRNVETTELLIRSVEPQPDLMARITAIDLSPGVYIADTGDIPEFNSQITLPYDVPKTIGSPNIKEIRSDEYVLIRSTDGTLIPRILITFEWKSGRLFDQIIRTEAKWRLSNSDGPWERIDFPNYVSEVSISNVTTGRYYDIECRYITIGNNVSLPTLINNYRVIGVTSPPPDVETLVLENTIIRWTYGERPIDFAGFRVRHRAGTNRTWADAIDAHNDLIKGTVFNIAALPRGTRTIMVKAEDATGNQSVNPAVLVKDFGDSAVDNVVTTYDYAANGFPGTITNGTIDGTDLEATGSVIFWAVDGNTTFWSFLETTVFWNAIYAEMSYEFSFIPLEADLPAELSLTYDIQGSPWSIYYVLNGNDIFWLDPDIQFFWDSETSTVVDFVDIGSMIWLDTIDTAWNFTEGISQSLFWDAATSWLTWPGALDASRQKYLFKIVIGSGTTQGIIFDLAAQVDVDDINEYLEDVSISALGTRLPITETYRSIITVQVTLQDDGGDGVIVRIVDKDISGPLIEVLDILEAGTTGLIDAHVQGY